MSVLDDPARRRAVDPGDMLGVVESSPDQLEAEVERARSTPNMPAGDGIDSVVVCGMGGSGIGGDVLAAALAADAHFPVTVVKGYTLPAFVGRRSFVIASSYSGNTEETLSCFDEAVARGAKTVAVTTGGALAARAAAANVPVVGLPGGLQPRAAFPSLVVAPLVVLERAGLVADQSAAFAAAASAMRDVVATCAASVETVSNPAKRLASRLRGAYPVVWGQEGPLAVVASRWRCQLNENAKVPAFSSVLPELDHNELVGYTEPGPAGSAAVVVVLRSAAEHPRIAARIDATLDEMSGSVAGVEHVEIPGAAPLAVVAAGALRGDFVSVYLALAAGIDPTPVEAIERLKASLAG